MNSKYSNVLTIVLVVAIILIIGIIGFLGYRVYTNSSQKNNTEDFVDSYNNNSNTSKDPSKDESSEVNSDWIAGLEGNQNISSEMGVQTYKGFVLYGTIEIPATNVSYPILDYSASALEEGICRVYGQLNQVGNATLYGHNYKDGRFFANNKKLNIGDKVYITDSTGVKKSYTIYNKYETASNDSSYMERDTEGAIEVSLSTCTDDVQARLVILARAD